MYTWTVDFRISHTHTNTSLSWSFYFHAEFVRQRQTHNNIHIILYDQQKPIPSTTTPITVEAHIVSTENTPCNYYAIIAKSIKANANSRSIRIIIPTVLFARFYFTIWRCRFPS